MFLSIVLAVLIVLTTGLAIWLANQHILKFRIMKSFIVESGQVVTYSYKGPKEFGKSPHMRTIVLRGRKPFSVLIGFDLVILGVPCGWDFYGSQSSEPSAGEHVVIINTFFGYGAADFHFFVNTSLAENPLSISTSDEDQLLDPQQVFPPHAIQRMGF